MITIWKYGLALIGLQTLHIPRGAQPLSVQIQNNEITTWWRLRNDNLHRDIPRRVFIFGTGNDATQSMGLQYLGTVQLDGFVWHVFIEPEVE